MVRLIIPRGEMRSYIWLAAPADINGFIDHANAVMDELYPDVSGAAYMELGFTTRVYKMQDYMKVMNIAVVFAQVFIYCFVALLMLIGLTNVISTISANVRLRSREFAVLQSVGMTRDGIYRMLNLESLICSAKALVIGLPLAVALTYLINLAVRSMLPVPYQLPWFSAVLCTAGVFAITWVTMRCSLARMQKGNIVEAIHN